MNLFLRGVTLAFNPAGVLPWHDDEPEVWTQVMYDLGRARGRAREAGLAKERADTAELRHVKAG